MRARCCAALLPLALPLSLAMLPAAPSSAQLPPDETVPAATQKTPIPTEGFWPTKLLLKRMIDRLCEQLGDEYHMDDEQRARTTELLQKRFTGFLDDNRG